MPDQLLDTVHKLNIVVIVKSRVHEVINDDRVFTPSVPVFAGFTIPSVMFLWIFYYLYFSCLYVWGLCVCKYMCVWGGFQSGWAVCVCVCVRACVHVCHFPNDQN